MLPRCCSHAFFFHPGNLIENDYKANFNMTYAIHDAASTEILYSIWVVEPMFLTRKYVRTPEFSCHWNSTYTSWKSVKNCTGQWKNYFAKCRQSPVWAGKSLDFGENHPGMSKWTWIERIRSLFQVWNCSQNMLFYTQTPVESAQPTLVLALLYGVVVKVARLNTGCCATIPPNMASCP